MSYTWNFDLFPFCRTSEWRIFNCFVAHACGQWHPLLSTAASYDSATEHWDERKTLSKDDPTCWATGRGAKKQIFPLLLGGYAVCYFSITSFVGNAPLPGWQRWFGGRRQKRSFQMSWGLAARTARWLETPDVISLRPVNTTGFSFPADSATARSPYRRRPYGHVPGDLFTLVFSRSNCNTRAPTAPSD